MPKYLANVDLLFDVPVTENPVKSIGALTDKFLDVDILDCDLSTRLIGYTSANLKKVVDNIYENNN